LPTVDQINRFRWYYRTTKINQIVVKDKATYTEWVNARKINPEKPNDLFVINHKLDKNNFIFVVSSITLLKNAKKEEQYEEGYVCVDSTYKLMTCFSTWDKSRKIKIIAFAIVSHETIVNYEFILSSIRKCIQNELDFTWEIKVNLFYL